MPLAPNHALVDELLSDSGNGCRFNAECCRNVSSLIRSLTALCHRTQIFLLQSCQPVETHTEKVSIEMRDDFWCRLFDVDSVDRGTRRRVPDMKSPFLKKIGIALRDTQNFSDGIVIEKNTLVLGRVNQRISCRREFERPHLWIGEQTFRIRLGVARQRRQLWQTSADEQKREIPLRHLVTRDDERCQFVMGQVLHFVDEKADRGNCAP